MSPDVTVRPPRSTAEMRDVRRVDARCWVEAYGHIVPADALPDPDDDPDEARLRDGLAHATELNETGSGRYVVAVDESAPSDGSLPNARTGVVGFAATRWADEDTKSFVGRRDAELWVLYVDPARWNRGVGSALLARVTAAVPDRFDRLVLEAFAENDVGRRFYRARGFDVVDRAETRVGGEAHPAVVMARPLTD